MVVAVAENDIIGRDGRLPWHLPEDLKRFRTLTSGHVVLAGRRTHQSIVDRLGHPLAQRFTVVVTQSVIAGDESVVYQPSVAAALSVARGVEAFAGGDEVFIIGGAQIYAQTMDEVDTIYLTRVHASPEGDTSMPSGWLNGFVPRDEEAADGATYFTYHRA